MIANARKPEGKGNAGFAFPIAGVGGHAYRVDALANASTIKAQDLTPVGRSPPKQIIGKFSGIIPTQFLCDKVLHTALYEDLRQLPGKAKTIGQPGDRTQPTKLLQPIALPIKHLTHQGFTAD
jgi:hypothetical protein